MKAAEEMTTEQFEQAKRDMIQRWGGGNMERDLTALLEQHKEVILREELIKFLEWDGITDELARKITVKKYLENMKR